MGQDSHLSSCGTRLRSGVVYGGSVTLSIEAAEAAEEVHSHNSNFYMGNGVLEFIYLR